MVKNKTTLLPIILVLIIIAVFAFVISTPNNNYESDAKYEITKTDIFSLEEFNANDVSVMGLKVGDRTQILLETLGSPDLQTDYRGGTSTLEYSESIGLEEPGLIVLLDNGVVKRITMKPTFNEFLVGSTKAGLEKTEIYAIFGVPEEVVRMPLKQDSTLVIKSLLYHSKGLEFTIRKNTALGFSLNLNDQGSN
ncbi:hypothetical protein HOF78_02795 [Candidatus Woesearchaeota archaeon]|nr:hypothetical protein [Candidatus Woesearchaeota archaeon]MBT6044667.1 hypothetical protein [Candidatus Woesearchaeota archaeon]